MHIGFSWAGLPDYAARCIGHFISRYDGKVTILATRPNVPIEGMEESIGCEVRWIDERTENIKKWSDVGSEIPDLFFQSGVFVNTFNRLGDECRFSKKPVVLLSDNNWTGSFSQSIIQPLRHRLLLRKKFFGVFVPGKSAKKYSVKMGYSDSKVLCGMYGADPILFGGGIPSAERKKTMIYVGQFVRRKNVCAMAKAFARFSNDYPQWNLIMCGSGELKNSIIEHKNITTQDFVQPEILAEMLRQARCLVLPSLEEHWGVVSDAVGASADFACPDNSIIFKAEDENSIYRSFCHFANLEAKDWHIAEKASRSLASDFGPKSFADTVDQFISMCGK
jgi:glycosyltransferase involved in cell wall biosynthesis